MARRRMRRIVVHARRGSADWRAARRRASSTGADRRAGRTAGGRAAAPGAAPGRARRPWASGRRLRDRRRRPGRARRWRRSSLSRPEDSTGSTPRSGRGLTSCRSRPLRVAMRAAPFNAHPRTVGFSSWSCCSPRPAPRGDGASRAAAPAAGCGCRIRLRDGHLRVSQRDPRARAPTVTTSTPTTASCWRAACASSSSSRASIPTRRAHAPPSTPSACARWPRARRGSRRCRPRSAS